MSNEQRYRADLLAQLLREQGRKQRWLAEQIGISESIVSEWIHGRRTIGEQRARQVSRILDVPFFSLFPVTVETETVDDETEAVA